MSKRGEILDLSNIKRNDLIYLAGLIDGDGCFYISKRTKKNSKGQFQYMLKLQVHCINEAFVDSLYTCFGGVKIVNIKKPPRRPLYGIEFTGNRLTQICELLLPFIRLKRPNCENMLKMRKTYNGKGGRIYPSDAEMAIRDHCFDVSRSLNTHKPFNYLPPCCPSISS